MATGLTNLPFHLLNFHLGLQLNPNGWGIWIQMPQSGSVKGHFVLEIFF